MPCLLLMLGTSWYTLPLVIMTTTGLAGMTLAQNCEPQWRPLDPGNLDFVGLNTTAFDQMLWDPDGAGPKQRQLVVGGRFTVAGTTLASGVAAYDFEEQGWHAFGEGVPPEVYALGQTSAGEVLVGGLFPASKGLPLNSLARWDGSTWTKVGGPGQDLGTGPAVYAVTSNAQGHVIAGGLFQGSGSPLNNIGFWNGSKWLPFGGGFNERVLALAVLPNNDVIAGGMFSKSGSTQMMGIARWDGANWSSMGDGIIRINTLAVLPTGELLAGGLFPTIGPMPAKHIARWNGTQWFSLGAGVGDEVKDLVIRANGSIVAAEMNYVREWDGQQWTTYPGYPVGVASMIELPDGALCSASQAVLGLGTGLNANFVARWGGTDWTNLYPAKSIDGTVNATAARPTGEIVIGGAFTMVGAAQPIKYIAQWDGSSWSSLGSGTNGRVQRLVTEGNGDVIAGGFFTKAGGLDANYIARWDGAAWSALGSGTSGPVKALLSVSSGDLIVGGDFAKAGDITVNRLARWDGDAWSSIGGGVTGSAVYALTEMPSGDLVIGGTFQAAGGVSASNIARWNGASWSALGAGIGVNGSNVNCLAMHPSGDLFAGGSFTKAGGQVVDNLARWDGANWSAVGPVNVLTAAVHAMHIEANGDLLVSSRFENADPIQSSSYFMRWDGVQWSSVGEAPGVDSWVRSITRHPNGDLLVSGSFASASGVMAPYVARYGCVLQACYADCDVSGSLNIDDFICFQTTYAMGDPAADCDASGTLDIDDFVCFQTFYAVGC